MGSEEIIRHFGAPDPWDAFFKGKSPLLIKYEQGQATLTKNFVMEADTLLAKLIKLCPASANYWYDHTLPWSARKGMAIEAYFRNRPSWCKRAWVESEARMMFQTQFNLPSVRDEDLANHVEMRRTLGHSEGMIELAVRFWKSYQF